MTDDLADVRTVDLRSASSRRLAAQLGPVATVTVDDTLPRRLVTAGEYVRGTDGRWAVRWHAAITGQYWTLDTAQVARQIHDARMLGPDAPPPTPERLAGIVAALTELLDQREAAAHAPATPTNLITLAAALAGRLVRSRDVWRGRDGKVMWRRRPADPVLGSGPSAMPQSRDGWAARLGIGKVTVPGAEPVTAETVRRAVEAGTYIQYGERVTDWGEVVAEINALARAGP